ncbi:hypothetical protein HY605_04500, partial [Candidatus Peregrinibacteria bacterium]|nr:hypothetical protein [Candidatus Peregrinibacteria bacterium]
MPEEVHETIVNDRLSQLLNREFGMDSRAERTTQRKRPDIIVSSKGLLIGIETSFQKDDAERDALERMNQRRADLVIALWLKTRYSGLSESELDTAIKGSTFDVKVLSETHERLDAYLPQKLRNRLSPEGWFTDIVLSDLKDFIDSAPEFLVKEEKVVELMSRVEEEIYFFVRSMSSVDRDGEHAKKFYDLFWKLYGLSLGKSPSEISDVIFGQVALSILLSSAFYEHARDFNPDFKDLDSRIQSDPINGLKQSLQDLLRIDYKVALRTTVEILTMLPISMAGRTKHLCQLGIRIAEDKALLRRDFAGRIYHRITGDLALKKGFATFYTEIPSAYLLTGLSFDALLENTTPEKQVKLLEDIKVGDFACGSGTLLTSSVHVVDRIASRLKFFDEVDVDLDHLIQHMIEDGVYGIDALRYASQITAINLALISPSNLRKQNVYSVHLGYKKDSNFTWLGSLELLKDTESFAGLLAWIEGGLKGAVEKVSVEDIQEEISLPAGFDLIIMNPPFTRATGRSKKIEAGRNAFFGFIADEVARGKVKQSYELIRDDVRSSLTKIAEKTKDFPPDIHNIVIRKNSDLAQYLGVGQAGEGLIFLYMGYRLVKKDGVIGFVVPRSILAGVHWFLSRTLLASKFHVKYVIVSSDPNGYD